MIESGKKEIGDIPEKTGYYLLSDKDSILFVGKTSNLQKSIGRIFSSGKDDKNIFQLISLTEKVSYQETESLFSALLEEKKILEKHDPEFNRSIRNYDDYVYLAIDFYHVPFLKITENTQEDYFYLGPFQSRFFLYDLCDAMAALFRFPSCENENFPCARLKEEKCSGWCLRDKPEIAEMLTANYLQSNSSLLKKAESQRKKLLDNLEFLQLEVRNEQIALIEKYQELLQFLHTTKKLETTISADNRIIKIVDGMIAEIEENGKIRRFDNFLPACRSNEWLAHDKSQFSERLIIYREIKKNNLDLIAGIYKKSLMEMKRNLK